MDSEHSATNYEKEIRASFLRISSFSTGISTGKSITAATFHSGTRDFLSCDHMGLGNIFLFRSLQSLSGLYIGWDSALTGSKWDIKQEGNRISHWEQIGYQTRRKSDIKKGANWISNKEQMGYQTSGLYIVQRLDGIKSAFSKNFKPYPPSPLLPLLPPHSPNSLAISSNLPSNHTSQARHGRHPYPHARP